MQDEERNSCAPASHSHGQRDPPILFHSMTGFPHRIASRPAKSAYSTPTRHLTSGYLRQWGSALRYAGSYTRRPSAMGAARARLRASLPRRARLAPLRSPPSFPKPTRGDAGARWLLGSSARAGLHPRWTRAQDSCATRRSRALCYIPDYVDSRLSTATLMRRFYINLRSTSSTPFLNSSP